MPLLVHKLLGSRPPPLPLFYYIPGRVSCERPRRCGVPASHCRIESLAPLIFPPSPTGLCTGLPAHFPPRPIGCPSLVPCLWTGVYPVQESASDASAARYALRAPGAACASCTALRPEGYKVLWYLSTAEGIGRAPPVDGRCTRQSLHEVPRSRSVLPVGEGQASWDGPGRRGSGGSGAWRRGSAGKPLLREHQ